MLGILNRDEKPEMARPAPMYHIAVSLLIAVLLNLAPWWRIGLSVTPDFLALVLLFWAIYQPSRIGMSVAFIAGLFMDVAHGAYLGQYALAYVTEIFVAQLIRQRILRFDPFRQSLHVIVLLFVMQLALLLVHQTNGARVVGLSYFYASLFGAVLWPFMVLGYAWLAHRKTEY
ncbi:MAG: rod shape-determining protein MreD [Proteobacteria bacterium]|nr:rod shape-determining protein MreD [Pseudomonadota bacterium]MDE3208830.1 rod shape-determining protein MreD [Pseudomonadota bacterium]